jgi:hypothetical protein
MEVHTNHTVRCSRMGNTIIERNFRWAVFITKVEFALFLIFHEIFLSRCSYSPLASRCYLADRGSTLSYSFFKDACQINSILTQTSAIRIICPLSPVHKRTFRVSKGSLKNARRTMARSKKLHLSKAAAEQRRRKEAKEEEESRNSGFCPASDWCE